MRLTRKKIRAALQRLVEVQRRCTARTLGEADVLSTVDIYRCARRIARRLGVADTVRVRRDGGAVCNSYLQNAATTVIIIDGEGISVFRGRARFAAFGVSRGVKVSMNAPVGEDGKTLKAADVNRPRSVKEWYKRDGRLIWYV